MEPSRVDRKLTAILSADVFGYSRLMGADEEATVRTLTAYRQVFLTTIPQYYGRVVDAKGDALLAEFPTVTDAVRCAVAIQRELAERNAALPPDHHMAFRIGVNLGEVLVREEEIYGDGVNIAARLEALAEPGGICISGSVYDNVQTKLDVGYAYLGEQEVKNIRQPIRAYWVMMDPQAAPDNRSPRPWTTKRWQWVAVAAIVVLLVGAVVAWRAFLRPTQAPITDVVQESTGGTAGQPTPTQEVVTLDKHRIAVLPFVNMSVDAENEYFSDGMTEELISHLSRISDLEVIARTSVMTYKGKEKKIPEIGQELRVGTVLEGSVRKVENQVRITVQLINVHNQTHLWSQDYDRELTGIFTIQSDIAKHVTEALKVKFLAGEQQRIEQKGTESLEVYDLYLKGFHQWNRGSKEGLERSVEYFKQAIEKDPTYAQAYVRLGSSFELLMNWGFLPQQEALPQAKAAAIKAVELDDTNSDAHAIMGNMNVWDWNWSAAESAYKRAIQLNPNSALAHNGYGILYLSPMGRHDEAIVELRRAIELDPLNILDSHDLGWAFLLARQYDRAIEQLQKILEMEPNYVFVYWDLGLAYAAKGMYEKALAAMQKRIDQEGSTPSALGSLGWAYGISGKREEALKVLDRLKERAKQEPVDPIEFAWVYAGLSEKDLAIEWLQKTYEERSGSWQLIWLKVAPWYDNLRSDPRFTELLRKVGLPTD